VLLVKLAWMRWLKILIISLWVYFKTSRLIVKPTEDRSGKVWCDVLYVDRQAAVVKGKEANGARHVSESPEILISVREAYEEECCATERY